jgi:hypothetical protein
LTTIGCLSPLLLFILFFLGLFAASAPMPVTPVAATAGAIDTRTLAISAMPHLDPAPTGSRYQYRAIEAIGLAYQVGARGMHLSDKWSDLEPSAGSYRLDDFSKGIEYLSLRGFTIQLALQIVNTTAKETPPDLLPMSFNSKKMKDRFHAFFDALLPHLSRNVEYLSIGNEVDVYLAAHDEWIAYKEFYEDVAAYIHNVASWIKVGVTCTFGGATSGSAGQVAALNESSDVYMLTYYPLTAGFMVQEPTVPLTDIAKMVALAKGRPLILQEVGYPTSALLGSSEQKQADFIANVYEAWHAAGGHIPFLNFFLMHDFTPAMCDGFEMYYGLPHNRNFYEFLCTLGLRRADGTTKRGWQVFVDGAADFRAK